MSIFWKYEITDKWQWKLSGILNLAMDTWYIAHQILLWLDMTMLDLLRMVFPRDSNFENRVKVIKYQDLPFGLVPNLNRIGANWPSPCSNGSACRIYLCEVALLQEGGWVGLSLHFLDFLITATQDREPGKECKMTDAAKSAELVCQVELGTCSETVLCPGLPFAFAFNLFFEHYLWNH